MERTRQRDLELKETLADYLEAMNSVRHVLRTYPPHSPRWRVAMDHLHQVSTDVRASWDRSYGAPAR